jgi:hypothetical protein
MVGTMTSESKMTKVDLFPMFKRGVARQYPEAEGWKVYNRFNWVSYLHDFVLQREHQGSIERVVVEIITDKKIREEQVAQLRDIAQRLEHDGTRVSKKIMVVADGSDVSGIPGDIEVFFLGDFLKHGLTNQASVGRNGKAGQGKMVA